MMTDAITAMYNLLSDDARLKDDVGTNTLINFFSKAVSETPNNYPAITFGVDPNIKVSVISLGNKRFRKFPVKVYMMIEDWTDEWDAYLKVDKVAKNVEQIILEKPNLGTLTIYNSDVIGEQYGVIKGNDGVVYQQVLELTVEVTERFAVNQCPTP